MTIKGPFQHYGLCDSSRVPSNSGCPTILQSPSTTSQAVKHCGPNPFPPSHSFQHHFSTAPRTQPDPPPPNRSAHARPRPSAPPTPVPSQAAAALPGYLPALTCVFSPSRKACATRCRMKTPKSRCRFVSSTGHSSQSFRKRRYLVAAIGVT